MQDLVRRVSPSPSRSLQPKAVYNLHQNLDSYLLGAKRRKKHAIVSFPDTPTPSQPAIGHKV